MSCFARPLLPVLADDFQPFLVRAHRERGIVMAGLVRQVARWISTASR